MQGCSALSLDSCTFIDICERFPTSFAILRARSEKRRKVLAQYKYEALSDIMQLSLKKFEVEDHKKLVTDMYGLLKKGPTVPDIVLEQSKKRISLLKTISNNEKYSPGLNFMRFNTSK